MKLSSVDTLSVKSFHSFHSFSFSNIPLMLLDGCLFSYIHLVSGISTLPSTTLRIRIKSNDLFLFFLYMDCVSDYSDKLTNTVTG